MRFYMMMAILPAILLIYFVWKKDPTEKEPLDLLGKLAGFGALTTISAMILETVMEAVFQSFLPEDSILYIFLYYFIGVALSEEGGKYLMLRWRTWKDRHFNYSYDAIVYAVAVSMGFATIENILYVLLSADPFSVALLRGVLSVPGHAFFGVFMGYFHGQAKRSDCIRNFRARDGYHVLALLVPTILHGIYDFTLSVGAVWSIIAFVVFEIFMTVMGIRLILHSAQEVTPVSEQYRPLRFQPPVPPVQQPGVPGYPAQPQIPAQPQAVQMPQYPQYGAPQQPQQPQYPQYGTPQQPGQPQYPQYGTPQQPQQPQYPQYGTPQQQQYPQYGTPQPQQPQYPQYGTPQQPQQPQYPQYGTPQQPQQPQYPQYPQAPHSNQAEMPDL